MAAIIRRLAVIGQGLIGSSITRAAWERNAVAELVVTDASPKVRERVAELGLGAARVVESAPEAVDGADLVILCVPVGQIAAVAREVSPVMKPGAILSDVGSVKASVVDEIESFLPAHVSLVPAHPMAGTEFSGPDAGMPGLFVNRWCIVTPSAHADPQAVDTARRFWEALGSRVEIMAPLQHDNVVTLVSHLPHLIAYSIFHTALKHEERTHSEVIKFSAGGFRDFTRIASSNPGMWRDIFLGNKPQVLDMLHRFIGDLEEFASAIGREDGETLERLLSASRTARRRVIEKEHISVQPKPDEMKSDRTLIRPYSSEY